MTAQGLCSFSLWDRRVRRDIRLTALGAGGDDDYGKPHRMRAITFRPGPGTPSAPPASCLVCIHAESNSSYELVSGCCPE